MNNELTFQKDLTMTSLEVVDLINKYRELEGSRTKKRHSDLLESIRKEIHVLKNSNMAEEAERNFSFGTYRDSNNQDRTYCILSRDGILLIMNKESTIVRARTIEHINRLEDKITQLNNQVVIQQLQNSITQQQRQLDEAKQMLGLKSKTKFDWGKIIKVHLGIRKASSDYESIKQLFFLELGVNKWEDIFPSIENVRKLNEVCENYKPSKTRHLF